MSSDADRERVSPAYQLIHHYRERAHAAIQRYNEQSWSGDVPADVRKDLAASALDYYNALYEFRDEDALEMPWDDRGIDWLDDAEHETVTVERSLNRANGATTMSEIPVIQAVDAARVVRTIRELNDIVGELGLGVRIDESTPRTEIPDELFEEVEEWRQRNLE